MKVYVNNICGIDDAIASMFMSRRTWTRELEMDIRHTCALILSPTDGRVVYSNDVPEQEKQKFVDWMNKLTKWGASHITMLRYIDFSITVEGLHRGGQDDWDAHAKRYENRIIRTSTRMAKFGNEMSDYYQGKVLSTDVAAEELGVKLPESFEHDGKKFVKCVNGYVDEQYADNQDVKRGLYMLSIPSNFIFKVNLTEWAHVYKERNNSGHANPEVKECCEMIATQLEDMVQWFNRELFMNIKN